MALNNAPNMEKIELIKKEINEQIDYRKEYASSDFKRLQIMSWGSIVASFLSAILIASPLGAKLGIILAFLAAIPGLITAVESALNYGRRHKMNEDAYLTFQQLLFRLVDGEDATKIYHEFMEYRKKFILDFPSGTIPTVKQLTMPAAKTENRSGAGIV